MQDREQRSKLDRRIKYNVLLASVIEVRNCKEQFLVSSTKGTGKNSMQERSRARERWKERETHTEWDIFFKTYATHTFTLTLKTAKEVCMMFSVPNLAVWAQLKALHHTPTLTPLTHHIRFTDTGQKSHYGEKAATFSSMHHPTGQDNCCNLSYVL